jgi:ring-1,2-phenylacetyl-CoA epoxidase subunit PaaC
MSPQTSIDFALIDFSVHLADNALVFGHRNSEWTGHGPILEQDIALSNIALDLIGQARYFYQYAAGLINEKRGGGLPAAAGLRSGGGGPGGGAGLPMGAPGVEVTEDALAYGRDSWDFRNCLLAEQGNGDWAKTILRQFFFSAYQFCFYEQLQQSRDMQLSAIAEKSLKEVIYHLRWSSEWVIRLGDGTAESHHRMEKALDQLWKFTGELFLPAAYERSLATMGIAVDLEQIRPWWEEKVAAVFAEAQLTAPTGAFAQTGGKEGRHTEDLGYLLAEMQFLQRTYPDCEW